MYRGGGQEVAAVGEVLLRRQNPAPRLVPLISAQQQIGPFFTPSCSGPTCLFIYSPIQQSHMCPVWETTNTHLRTLSDKYECIKHDTNTQIHLVFSPKPSPDAHLRGFSSSLESREDVLAS